MDENKINPETINDNVFWGHSADRKGEWEPLRLHLERVASKAEKFAQSLGMSDEARCAGLLHDLGKYGEKFQLRLKDRASAVDHWSNGAWFALLNYKSVSTCAVIQGHHIGLQKISKEALSGLKPDILEKQHPSGLRLSESDITLLCERLEHDGIILPEKFKPAYDTIRTTASAMLDVRMLFSALVDADYLATEEHFTGDARNAPPDLDADKALETLLAFVEKVKKKSEGSGETNRYRDDLLSACLDKAQSSQGIFNLTAPTGSGKTLAMLAFALKHAAANGLRRIVLVVPYLTIIEQTASIYHEIFDRIFGPHYVIENHSLAETQQVENETDEHQKTLRFFSENWDAPVIITTSVQMFHSLFSNRARSCRKLHRLAHSVILFDEVQTFPADLAIPTLATLSRLVKNYSSSVLFATATQPAFSHLDKSKVDGDWSVREPDNIGWNPRRVSVKTPDSMRKRARIHWPEKNDRITWSELSRILLKEKRILCIVNLKRHAIELFSLLDDSNASGTFHLSTNLCPQHRKKTLEEVKNRLVSNHGCRLIATQCIEAGVDIDFPVVWRAWGPLEAIAQAAGRCNRNANLEFGDMHVFRPDDTSLYPSGVYRQASEITEMLFNLKGKAGMDINDENLFREYYRAFYDMTGIAGAPQGRAAEIRNAIILQDFDRVSRRYRIIEHDAINVLVPYKREIFSELSEEARDKGISRQWIKKSQAYCVNIYRPQKDSNLWSYLEPIKKSRMIHESPDHEENSEWFICLDEHAYCPVRGFVPPEDQSVLIA